jgi:hypothetical protein
VINNAGEKGDSCCFLEIRETEREEYDAEKKIISEETNLLLGSEADEVESTVTDVTCRSISCPQEEHSNDLFQEDTDPEEIFSAPPSTLSRPMLTKQRREFSQRLSWLGQPLCSASVPAEMRPKRIFERKVVNINCMDSSLRVVSDDAGSKALPAQPEASCSGAKDYLDGMMRRSQVGLLLAPQSSSSSEDSSIETQVTIEAEVKLNDAADELNDELNNTADELNDAADEQQESLVVSVPEQDELYTTACSPPRLKNPKHLVNSLMRLKSTSAPIRSSLLRLSAKRVPLKECLQQLANAFHPATDLSDHMIDTSASAASSLDLQVDSNCSLQAYDHNSFSSTNQTDVTESRSSFFGSTRDPIFTLSPACHAQSSPVLRVSNVDTPDSLEPDLDDIQHKLDTLTLSSPTVDSNRNKNRYSRRNRNTEEAWYLTEDSDIASSSAEDYTDESVLERVEVDDIFFDASSEL